MARVIAAKSEQSQCMEKNTQAKIGELKAIPVEARGRHSKRHIVRYNYYKKDAPKGNLRDAACMFPVFSNFFPPMVPVNPCRVLVSIPGTSPAFCMLLVPRKAFSYHKINEFDCARPLYLLHDENPSGRLLAPWSFSHEPFYKCKHFTLFVLVFFTIICQAIITFTTRMSVMS